MSARKNVRGDKRKKSYGRRLSRSLWPVAEPTAVHASCMRCAEGDGAAAKIASPGSCAHAVCAPGKNGGLGDITYVQTQEGWLYLSGILDHCSRRCVGWHADASLESSLSDKSLGKSQQEPTAQTRATPPFRPRRPVCQRPFSKPSAFLRRSRFHEPQSKPLRQCEHGKLLCPPQDRMLPKPNPKKSP